jgi:hypothetical protein
MADDVVNIHLVSPRPIQFDLGDGRLLRISGAISMRKGFECRRLINALGEAATDMELKSAAAGLMLEDLQAKGGGSEKEQAALVKAGDDAEAAVTAYEQAGDDLIDNLAGLIKAHDPEQAIPDLNVDAAQRMTAVVWRRAMGATDAQLETAAPALDDEVPPTNGSRKRSTSRPGSTPSVRPTAAPRPRGSRSR